MRQYRNMPIPVDSINGVNTILTEIGEKASIQRQLN